jgi:hypothetical protein
MTFTFKIHLNEEYVSTSALSKTIILKTKKIIEKIMNTDDDFEINIAHWTNDCSDKNKKGFNLHSPTLMMPYETMVLIYNSVSCTAEKYDWLDDVPFYTTIDEVIQIRSAPNKIVKKEIVKVKVKPIETIPAQ